MTIPGSANPLLLASAAAEPTAYEIERSVRFNSADSAYLSRTPASAGNRKTWTWAGWVKRSKLGGFQPLFAVSGGDAFRFENSPADALSLNNSGALVLASDGVFRDTSAWYHVVCAVDTTQASNRVKMYVNGTLQKQGDPYSLNEDTPFNSTVVHEIGRNPSNTSRLFNGYLADVHFIDGQALDPTSFGEFDANGIWQPITYTGSYGTNGFHLPFSDNSTAAALGTDTSGNSNTWTVNNISVTAGAGNDSLVDVPTNGTETDTGIGGQVRGNYATLNPLNPSTGSSWLSNGNLDFSGTVSSAVYTWVSSIGMTSGKFYFECAPLTALSGGTFTIGITRRSSPGNLASGSQSTGLGQFSDGYVFNEDGNKINNNVSTAYGAAYNDSNSNIIGCYLDLDTGVVGFTKNGVDQGTAFSSLPSGTYYFTIGFGRVSSQSGSGSTNFGQRPFAYTAPSGFKALCTANLPAPVVTKPSTVMDVALDTGANILSAAKALCGGNANFLWIKDRVNGSTNHHLIDIVRDPQLDGTPFLASNSTSNEATLGSYSAPSGNSVGWAWYAGGSTVSNPDGSITSSVRANPSAGFSIVSYTGNATAGATVGHSLNDTPAMYIVKDRDSSNSWYVYHKNVTTGKVLILNTTDAENASSFTNGTEPTSSVFSLGSAAPFNGSGNKFIAYCFAPVDGYSSFGSYTGNGSTDGPFVYTGFRPRYIMIKSSSVGGSPGYDWIIHDTARSTYNLSATQLIANSSVAENQDSGGSSTAGAGWDILSNGFKIRTSSSGRNQSGQTYIYVAFAESPFQYARAR